MPDLREYYSLMERRQRMEQAALKPTHAHIKHAPRLLDVTMKAQTIVDHPGWQWFLDALESRVKTLTDERDQIARRMVSGDEMGADLERLKIRLNRIDAELTGLRYAATLVPQAVELGTTIIAGVNRQAAAAGIADQRA